jgi:hypothetical protein
MSQAALAAGTAFWGLPLVSTAVNLWSWFRDDDNGLKIMLKGDNSETAVVSTQVRNVHKCTCSVTQPHVGLCQHTPDFPAKK